MEQLWEKGEITFVQEQRGKVTASTHYLGCGRIVSVSQSFLEKVCLAEIGITHCVSLEIELELAAGKS